MQQGRMLLRTDGSVEHLKGRMTMQEIEQLIGATGLDTVPLRHMGEPLHVMIVDDLGHGKGKPLNQQATHLYRKNCKPGTTHVIRGDVVIMPDRDYSKPNGEPFSNRPL